MKKVLEKVASVHCSDINSRGSGFIISSDGLIATNAHVVRQNNQTSTNIIVRFDDQSQLEAQVSMLDETKDFAILKVNASKELKFFELVVYDKFEEFSDVIFAGQGLDLPRLSIHKGWASRKIDIDGVKALQIDGPINQGNSGGPVLDQCGRVIGIITRTEAKFDSDLAALLQIIPNLQGDIQMFGIRLPETLRRIIFFLNRNRFVGVGYAFAVDYLKDALEKIRSK
ncbi:MAG: serine protease [Candidatus Gracilibacteria bacterium]|nr:serine protease [Candidatus Gracilibacteria bacterium]